MFSTELPSAVHLTAGYTGEMIEGKNYTLTCHIQDVAPTQYLVVKWFKAEMLLKTDHKHQSILKCQGENDVSAHYQTKKPSEQERHGTGMGPQNMTFDLLITPSVSDNGEQYKCEAELQLGPNSPPLKSDQHVLTVQGELHLFFIVLYVCVLSRGVFKSIVRVYNNSMATH